MPVLTKAKTPCKPKLYLKSRIARRWRLEIESANRALFFSPYITGQCADRILLVAGGGNVELYTMFLAENFATGASSLACLERLVNLGVKAFHLPDLHAKMLLVPGRVATIGSQNLTSRGTRNKEATVLITDPTMVGQTETEVLAWLGDREEITPTMIEELSKQLPILKKRFREALNVAASLDEQVMRRQRERDNGRRGLSMKP